MGALLAATQAVAVPQCRIQRYDENDGLTQWHVTQVTQDGQGMMWFATWNGLCRYDGYAFAGFKGQVGDGSGLLIDRFRSVWLMDNGNLGVRADEDVFEFNLKTCRFSKAPDGTVPTFRNAKTVKADRPYRHRTADGTLWTVYYDGRLTYAPAGGQETDWTGSPRMESARLCYPDRQGNLWVAAVNGLYKLSFMQRKGEVDNLHGWAEVKAMLVDRRGRLWVATKEDNSVAIYDRHYRIIGYLKHDGRISQSHTALGMPVYCIRETKDGTVWLGSKPGGLYRMKEKPGGMAYNMKKVEGLDCDNVYDVAEDRWGRLWVATLGGGICCVVNPKADRPQVLQPFKTLKNYPRRLGKKVRMIYITKSGILLAAATDGLVAARLLPGKGVGRTMFRCHTREAGRKDALGCGAVMNIAEDYRGRIFVSTESGGINMIETRDLAAPVLSFRHYDRGSGLPTDVVLSVVPYGKGLIAVGSNSIMIFNPDKGTSMRFGKRDFLYDCRFSEAVPCRLADGRWVFGLHDGLYTVGLEKLGKSRFVPRIALADVSIQGKPNDTSMNLADTIVLGTAERSLTVSFAALDYSPEADLRYAFALVKGSGEDCTKWSELGANHSVSLLDLDPGEYHLLVKSTNADGVWVDNVREMTIIVTPKFSETLLARILLIVIILAAVGGVAYTYIYIRRINRQRGEALDAYLSLLNSGGKAKTEEGNAAPLRPELSAEDDALMRRISAFVEEHIGDSDVSVGDMADAVAMSRSVLQRKMKQVMGVSPLDFIKEARIKHACHLLSTTTMPVSDVAFACGYSDPKYFSRSFKASTGKSPKEWRA